MKLTTNTLVAILLSSALSCAYAAVPGSYLGAGFSNPHSGLRGFGGYNFNRYLGLEAGVTDYATIEYTGHTKPNSSLDYSMTVFDVLAKPYLPLGQSGFDFYGLAGAAVVKNKTEMDYIGTQGPASTTNRFHKIRPKVGVGVSYAIPKSKVSTSIEFTHLQGSGDPNTNPHAIPSANTVMLNFTYNFD